MFDDLGYYTRVEQEVLKVSHDGVIIVRGSKICGLYNIKGSNVAQSSLTSGNCHDKIEV